MPATRRRRSWSIESTRLIRVVLWCLGIGVALYGLIAAGLFVFQRQLLYVPDRTRPDLSQLGLPDVREVEVATADGLGLLAWYRPPPNGAPVIVYLHGNGGHIGYRNVRLARFHEAGFGALFLEWRGYGGNPGRPSEQGFYTDARAALDFLAAQGVAPTRTVLYGESLGSGVAVQMASERPVGAVVLETPYSSIADVAQHHYPYVPARLLLKDRFDAVARIGAVRAPILVMLAGRDVVVPSRFGRALFDAAPEPKELWVAPDSGHEDMRDHGGIDKAIAFIRQRVPSQPR